MYIYLYNGNRGTETEECPTQPQSSEVGTPEDNPTGRSADCGKTCQVLANTKKANNIPHQERPKSPKKDIETRTRKNSGSKKRELEENICVDAGCCKKDGRKRPKPISHSERCPYPGRCSYVCFH